MPELYPCCARRTLICGRRQDGFLGQNVRWDAEAEEDEVGSRIQGHRNCNALARFGARGPGECDAVAAIMMAKLARVRVEGDLYHPRVPAGAIYVGRAAPGLAASPFANPHRIGKPCRALECAGAVHTRDEAVDAYQRYVRDHPELAERIRREVGGWDVACWCRLGERCHGDYILAVAAGGEP